MRYAWIEQHRDQYTVSQLCRVLEVSRSGYCQWRVRPPSKTAVSNQALDAKVAAVHKSSRRSYGRHRIVQSLRQQGEIVSAERVRKSLQRQRAGGIHHARIVGHEGQAHGLAAGGDDGALERHHLLQRRPAALELGLGTFLLVLGQFDHFLVQQGKRVTIPRQSRGLSNCEPLKAAKRGR